MPFPPVRNSELRALHVELRLVCGADRDRLEADHVVAIGRCRGDSRHPREVLCNHLAGAPVPVSDTAREETGLIDLQQCFQ